MCQCQEPGRRPTSPIVPCKITFYDNTRIVGIGEAPPRVGPECSVTDAALQIADHRTTGMPEISGRRWGIGKPFDHIAIGATDQNTVDNWA
jgi:hypothetical protein